MASRYLSPSGKRSENQEKQASNKTVLLAEESLDLQIRTVSEEVDKKRWECQQEIESLHERIRKVRRVKIEVWTLLIYGFRLRHEILHQTTQLPDLLPNYCNGYTNVS